MNFFIYLFVGLVSGWATTEITDGPRHHFLRNMIIGMIGALLGGYVFEILGLPYYNFWEAVGISMVGATVLLVMTKLVCRPQNNLVRPAAPRGKS